MKNLVLFLALLMLFTKVKAQTTGIILNSEDREAIPYVNIQIEGSRIGYSADINGRFSFTINSETKLYFSAIGYETLELNYSELTDTLLMDPVIYDLNTVTIPAENKSLTINKLKKRFYEEGYANCYGSYVLAFYFPYQEEYAETPYIKSLGFITDGRDAEDPVFKVHLLEARNQKPDAVFYPENILVKVNEGNRKDRIELKKHWKAYPKEGIFVAIEWMNLEQNKYEISFRNHNKKKVSNHCLAPSFLCSYNKFEQIVFKYENGEWRELGWSFTKPIQIEMVLTN